jgi:integrase
MLATTLCRDSDPADSSVNGHFRSFRAVYSRHTLREGARAHDVRDILGHANIDVTQNVYGKNCWEEREDAVTQAVEAMTNAAQNADKEENQPELAPADGVRITG